MNKTFIIGGSLSALLILLFAATVAHQAQAVTFSPIASQMGLGATGGDVTNLQLFLASNRDIYPEGRVTGYFGPLTQKAVQQFQLAYNIQTTGYVGPLTLARINSVIAAGYGIDIYAPSISSVSISKTTNSATVNWGTNEMALGKVYYSTTPFVAREALTSFSEPEIIGGSNVAALNMQTSQSVTLTGLQANTLYHYIIVVKDASGNVSVTPSNTFMTN